LGEIADKQRPRAGALGHGSDRGCIGGSRPCRWANSIASG
jgi:hypothetical protein